MLALTFVLFTVFVGVVICRQNALNKREDGNTLTTNSSSVNEKTYLHIQSMLEKFNTRRNLKDGLELSGYKVALFGVHFEGNLGDMMETIPLLQMLANWGVEMDCYLSSWMGWEDVSVVISNTHCSLNSNFNSPTSHRKPCLVD